MPITRKKIWKFNRAVHRDLGYFVSALVIAYCISGIALNHIDAWNPDFQIVTKEIKIPKKYKVGEFTKEHALEVSKLVGEDSFRIFDMPTPNQVKIYYKEASLHIHLDDGRASYEKISRRPLFYQVNVLHRNSFKPWKWVADIFALLLILINITGLFVLKGSRGLTGRGWWFIAAGALPPLIALVLYG